MTKRKPLQWYDSTVDGAGVGGKYPDCDKCTRLLFMPGFTEAVHSVAIEHTGSPAALAKRTIDSYHARRHPAGEWGLQ
jgi:hypothetical protein